jgi:hypothetical protein
MSERERPDVDLLVEFGQRLSTALGVPCPPSDRVRACLEENLFTRGRWPAFLQRLVTPREMRNLVLQHLQTLICHHAGISESDVTDRLWSNPALMDDAERALFGHKAYGYVGPAHLRKLASSLTERVEPDSVGTLDQWLRTRVRDRAVTTTYVVTLQGRLRVAERNAEHVACAGGDWVFAAGEMTFALPARSRASVIEVTNQSTGYCPEPSCFPAVRGALVRIGMAGPESFSHAFEFRRCPACNAINLVKDENYECSVCEHALPRQWNCDVVREDG